jgi:hypothetical protein
MYSENTYRLRTLTTGCLIRQVAMISLCCGFLHAYSAGPPPRYSGAPGDNLGSCTSCHRGQPLNSGQGSVKILLPNGNSYSPGIKQHIMVQVSDPQQRRWGFQMSARSKSNQVTGQAGDLAQPTASLRLSAITQARSHAPQMHWCSSLNTRPPERVLASRVGQRSSSIGRLRRRMLETSYSTWRGTLPMATAI